MRDASLLIHHLTWLV